MADRERCGWAKPTSALYLAYLGVRMILAKPGDAPVLNMRPRQFFRQAMLITLLNPKAIVFYMAFFPLFVDPARHQGLLTFGVMAATIAVLTFLYCVIVIAITGLFWQREAVQSQVMSQVEGLVGAEGRTFVSDLLTSASNPARSTADFTWALGTGRA